MPNDYTTPAARISILPHGRLPDDSHLSIIEKQAPPPLTAHATQLPPFLYKPRVTAWRQRASTILAAGMPCCSLIVERSPSHVSSIEHRRGRFACYHDAAETMMLFDARY